MVVAHMSYSQLNSYLDCSARFYYERELKLPQTPSWAQLGGSAVHKMTELWDLASLGDQGVTVSQIQPFDFYLQKEVEETLERNEFLKESEIRPAGRKSTAWPNKEDRRWWEHHGPVFFEKWVNWRSMSRWEIWRADDGTPGIEVAVTVNLDGLNVVQYIDRVLIQPTGFPVVVDLKSGAQEPKGSQQLGLYGASLNERFGIDVEWGGFWMARTGQMGELWDLTSYTPERLAYEYGHVAEMKEKKRYIAHPSSFCGNCAGKDFCPAIGGKKANEVVQPWEAK